MEKWVRIEINSNVNIEEVEPREEPQITFICEPKSHLHDVKCEMTAIVPEKVTSDIMQIWREIRDENDVFDIANKLITVVLEYDDNPYVEMKFDNYELCIKINPPD